MSHSTYNLKKLSQVEQQARYDLILKFVQFNPFFAYLPYTNNPTNNYQRYSNETLNTMLLTLQYGNMEDDNEPMKKVYLDFVKDYQYNSEIYIREEQEKMLKYQQEQQLLAQQFAMQYNASTQPISLNANSKSREEHPNHEEYHLWHKFHTKAGDVIGFESKAEYDQFAHFKEKYGLEIKIKFDPPAKCEPNNFLLKEDKPASEPIAKPVVKYIPKDVSKPVILIPEPKQSEKPKEPSFKEIKKPINSVSKVYIEKPVNFEIAESQCQIVKRRHDRIAEQQFAMLFGMKSQNPLNGSNKNEHRLWHKFHTKVGGVIEFDSRATYEEFAQFKEKYGLDVKIMFNPANKQLGENKLVDEPEGSELQPKKKSRNYKRK